MTRIDQWGRWPVVLVWVLTMILGFVLVAGAFALADEGAELAAAFMVLNLILLTAGAMGVTWRWLTE